MGIIDEMAGWFRADKFKQAEIGRMQQAKLSDYEQYSQQMSYGQQPFNVSGLGISGTSTSSQLGQAISAKKLAEAFEELGIGRPTGKPKQPKKKDGLQTLIDDAVNKLS